MTSKWIEVSDGVHHYCDDRSAADDVPDGIIERGRGGLFCVVQKPAINAFWYAVVIGADPAETGHFWSLNDAKAWVEWRVKCLNCPHRVKWESPHRVKWEK